MDDDAGPPSIFVVAYCRPCKGDIDPYIGILQLDTPELQELQLETPEHIKTTEVDIKELVIIRFNKEAEVGRGVRWLISPLKSSGEDLYIVPKWGFSTAKPIEGYKFNLRAGMCEPITLPFSSDEQEGHVVNLGGRIYLLGYYWNHDRLSFFQCYDPDEKTWKSLQPLPQYRSSSVGSVVATAVWGDSDTILFNLENRNIWAYDVSKNEWLEVGVEDNRLYSIVGEAVVLGNTIYTLTDESFNLVLGLSIEQKKGIDGGRHLVLKCSSENLVPGLKSITSWIRPSVQLVHLSKDNFCLVQSCNLQSAFNKYQLKKLTYQDIKLTYIKLQGKNSMILEECVYKVKWPFIAQFDVVLNVVLCFSLPKGATTALEGGEIFNLYPFSEAVQKQEDEDNDSKLAKILAEKLGCSLYVRDLPPKVTISEVEMRLKEFGLIKTSRINGQGKRRAFFEFESATSKQLAIEASPIMIGDCPVILEEKLIDHR